MAKFFPSSTIQSIAGSIGDNTYSRVKSGLVIKAKSHPGSVHPYTITPKQLDVNLAFGTNTAKWQALTDGQRLDWCDAAKARPLSNIFGQRYYQSGANLFTSVNHNLSLVGMPSILDPVPFSSPVQINHFNLYLIQFLAPTFQVQYLGFTTDANTSYLVYATNQLSTGLQYVKNKYRLIAVIPPSSYNDFEILTQYTALYGVLRHGHKIHVKLRPISTANGIAGITLYNSISY